jgi:hypothetical protein
VSSRTTAGYQPTPMGTANLYRSMSAGAAKIRSSDADASATADSIEWDSTAPARRNDSRLHRAGRANVRLRVFSREAGRLSSRLLGRQWPWWRLGDHRPFSRVEREPRFRRNA